jgi:hypothetical protein
MVGDYRRLVLCLKGHLVTIGVDIVLNLLGFGFEEKFSVKLAGLGGYLY